MVAALSERLGVELGPRRLSLPNGCHLEIDGASGDLSVLCEAWAHQGPPKSAQRQKVLSDGFKLSFAARVLCGLPRLILLFCDEEAAAPFRRAGWPAAALREFGIEIETVSLSEDMRDRIRSAQARQFR
jgi:hypothetical protein